MHPKNVYKPHQYEWDRYWLLWTMMFEWRWLVIVEGLTPFVVWLRLMSMSGTGSDMMDLFKICNGERAICLKIQSFLDIQIP